MNAGAAISRGHWLLFLHADSELPPDWLEVIAEAETRAYVAGAFALGLDSRDWRARVIELGVRARVAMFGLPYGDQALFVRRDTFATLDGYRDLPLMEDIDFMRRVKTRGRLLKSRSVVMTSARRWEQDGWMRRSAQNAGLAMRFLAGASPAQLAQRYYGRKNGAVVMMARAPWTGGKTRLGVVAGEAEHADLRHALFLDTLDAVTSVADVEHIIACEPASECDRMRELVGPAVDVIAQRGDDLGQRMAHVFEDSFRLGMESVVVVGSDLPDLPSRLLREALEALRGHEARVVVGPASDGGYYLIGLNRPHPALFDRIEWSTERVLAQTREAATALGMQVRLLDEWTDVDDAADLDRLMRDTSESRAARTRAWSSEHLVHR
jgi:rSAM/selenodomain-associated transferase 1